MKYSEAYLTGRIEKYGSGFIKIRKKLGNFPDLQLRLGEEK